MRAKLSDDDCAQSRELRLVVKVVLDDIVVAFIIDIVRVVMARGKVKIVLITGPRCNIGSSVLSRRANKTPAGTV